MFFWYYRIYILLFLKKKNIELLKLLDKYSSLHTTVALKALIKHLQVFIILTKFISGFLSQNK